MSSILMKNRKLEGICLNVFNPSLDVELFFENLQLFKYFKVNFDKVVLKSNYDSRKKG